MEPLFIIGLFVVFSLLAAVSIHNRSIRLRNTISESWSNIDVQLKRRHNLIPNLVEVAKGYAKHEQDVFEKIATARESTLKSLTTVHDVANAERELVDSVNVFLARAEAYPELKSDQHFLELQRELVMTEDRIAAARRFYNANVRDLNTLIESFPASVIVGSQKKEDFFEVDEISVRNLPSVN